MTTKICFVCGLEKDLSEFYTHRMMADGHLNKCKPCTRSYSKNRYDELISDPVFKEKEKQRTREKYHRLGYRDKRPDKEKKKYDNSRYKQKYPEKYKARLATNKMSRGEGNHLHHWSYREEHRKDVIELSVKDHGFIHRYMIYDQERMMYRRIDTMELLDTKESHKIYIDGILS